MCRVVHFKKDDYDIKFLKVKEYKAKNILITDSIEKKLGAKGVDVMDYVKKQYFNNLIIFPDSKITKNQRDLLIFVYIILLL